MQAAEVSFGGQLVIVRMKGRQTILGGCCTECMLCSVYAVLDVCCTRFMLYSVLTHDHGMERYRGIT